MNNPIIALFGESERGEYRKAHFCCNVHELMENLGEPPPGTSGIPFAVQTLMHDFSLLFFRVREEGYSLQDYFEGMWLLEREIKDKEVSAVSMPGMGDSEIIDAVCTLCVDKNSILIFTESDFYDYLTDREH